jgi:hypothetical protein
MSMASTPVTVGQGRCPLDAPTTPIFIDRSRNALAITDTEPRLIVAALRPSPRGA